MISMPPTATYLPEDHANVLELVRQTCTELGCPELAKLIRVEWNARFTSKMGDAAPHRYRVRLSVPLFRRADICERRATIVHEVCHVVAPYLHGKRVQSHGPEWAHLMIRCGEEPERCHTVDNSDLRRRQARVVVRCLCQGTKEVSKAVATRMAMGRHYRCLQCNARLSLANPGSPA